MLSHFAGITLRILEGWSDITADLPSDSPPTLARGTGVGVIQFSVVRYQSGTKPVINEDELKALLLGFCKTHSLVSIEPSVISISNGLGVGGVSITAEEVMAVWYLSDGADVALVTYTSLKPENPKTREEIAEARAMVQSVQFS